MEKRDKIVSPGTAYVPSQQEAVIMEICHRNVNRKYYARADIDYICPEAKDG